MDNKQTIVSLSAIGLDSPGLVSRITGRIREMDGNILDVDQVCRRGLFTIFLIIDFSQSGCSPDRITSDLKQIEEETGLKIMLGEYDGEEPGFSDPGGNHIVTILGDDRPGVIAGISTFFHKHNINIETCRMIAFGTFMSMEMVINTDKILIDSFASHGEALDRMKEDLKDLCKTMNQSVVIRNETIFARVKKLVVFDVESCLIRKSSLTRFIEKIRGMAGTIQHEQSTAGNDRDGMEILTENARALKGIPIADLEKFGDILRLNPGTLELIRILKSMGFAIALISSGFGFFLKRIIGETVVDYAFSNTLVTDEQGVITGEMEEPLITGGNKDEILKFILKSEKINRDQVIAVGDGSSGSRFIKNVGLSIAFKPHKTGVITDGILNSDSIITLLYCLGLPKHEIDRYLDGRDVLSKRGSHRN